MAEESPYRGSYTLKVFTPDGDGKSRERVSCSVSD
jgi:hypothetical protein